MTIKQAWSGLVYLKNLLRGDVLMEVIPEERDILVRGRNIQGIINDLHRSIESDEKYEKSLTWIESRKDIVSQRRLQTDKRNIKIFKDMTIDYHPSKWKEIAAKWKMSRQRLHKIKQQIQKRIDNGEIDLSLFDY